MKALAVALALVWAAPAVAADKKYDIDISKTSKEVGQGKNGQFALLIKVKPGFKVSQEAPLKIKLASDGLKLKKSKLAAKDAKTKKWTSPEFGVPFVAEKTGAQSINVDATFFVCDEQICERKKEKLAIPVTVKQ